MSSAAPSKAAYASLRAAYPGAMLCILLALAASYLSEHYGGPAILFALLLGMAFNYLGDVQATRAGIDFTAQSVLRAGVALLGTQITVSQVMSLGIGPVVMVVAGVAITIVGGYWLARRFGLARDFSAITAVAVAICGASAALAICSVLPKDRQTESRTVVTVVGVTLLSTLAMILYPIVAGALRFDMQTAGIFFGGTIHDVAQVVGAGYTLSEDTAQTATIVKLLRVACLLPAALLVGLYFRRKSPLGALHAPVLPWFLVLFVCFVALNSLGVLPASAQAMLGTVSRWCLLAAIAALGLRTSLARFASVGVVPILAMLGQTALLAAFVLASILLFAA